MKIPGEYFDQTFQALVGNPDATQQLTEALSSDVKVAQNLGMGLSEQYRMLEASAITAFNSALPT